MSNPLKKLVGAGGKTVDDCKRAEAATKARLDTETAKLAQFQARYDNPEPGDTAETLAQLEKDITETKRAVHSGEG